MQELLIKYLSDIQATSAGLAVVFVVVGLLTSVVVGLIKKPSLSVKILGTFFVMAICFASNHPFIYGIGIFIVATLVTELEFLEKLAAIAWNRKEYWDYLKSSATPEEVADKIKVEVEEGVDADEGHEDEDQETKKLGTKNIQHKVAGRLVSQAYDFQSRALNVLGSPASPLNLLQLEREVAISGAGRRYVIDGIGYSKKAIYVIEVKFGASRRIESVLDQLGVYKSAFERYARERAIVTGELRGIVVLPHSAEVADLSHGIAVFKFDMNRGVFTNLQGLHDSFPNWDWSHG